MKFSTACKFHKLSLHTLWDMIYIVCQYFPCIGYHSNHDFCPSRIKHVHNVPVVSYPFENFQKPNLYFLAHLSHCSFAQNDICDHMMYVVHPSVNNFLWTISPLNFNKLHKDDQNYYQSFKRFGFRSGLMFVQSRSGCKLFAKVISRRQVAPNKERVKTWWCNYDPSQLQTS